MAKIFKTLSTSLDKDQFAKLEKICTNEECKPYTILKDALLQYIESYEAAINESKRRKENGDSTGTGQTKDNPNTRQSQDNDGRCDIETSEPTIRQDQEPGRELIEVTT